MTSNSAMMRARVLIPMVMAGAMIAAMPLLAHASAGRSTITIVMRGPAVSIDISVDPTEWEIEPVRMNASYSRDFTLTNTGTVDIDTTIVGTDASGSGYHWALADSPGHSQYEIEYEIEGLGETGNITESPTEFVEGLGEGQSKDFSLTVKTPASGDVPAAGETMQATVTIRAVER